MRLYESETYLESIERKCRATMAELRRVDYLPLSCYLGGREPRPSRPGDRAAWKAPWIVASTPEEAARLRDLFRETYPEFDNGAFYS